MKETQTCPLRLLRSLKEAVERLNREDRTSIDQLVATAVAEKVLALQTASYFTDRQARLSRSSIRGCQPSSMAWCFPLGSGSSLNVSLV